VFRAWEASLLERRADADLSERRRRILMIDCTRVIASHLGELFRGEGCDVYIALDEIRAMEHLSERRSSDLILLAPQSSQAGARDLRQQLANHGVHCPLVAATDDPDPRGYAETIGAVAYLPEPLALRDLDEFFDHLVVTGTRGAASLS
jgi:DNA-binding NtrC family response regulator